jgi:hypothetical protein
MIFPTLVGVLVGRGVDVGWLVGVYGTGWNGVGVVVAAIDVIKGSGADHKNG